MADLEELRTRAAGLPAKPGIYFFKSASGEVVYIGKARSLRDRVRSYFLANPDLKVRNILRETADIDYILTGSEKEAAFLENNYVQQHQPRFNLRLKDDKSFPYLKMTTGETVPRRLFQPQGRARRLPLLRAVQPGRPGPLLHPPRQQALPRPRLRGGRLPRPEAALPRIRAQALLGAVRRRDRRGRLSRERRECLSLSRRPDHRAGPDPQGADGASGRGGAVRRGGPPARPPADDRGLSGPARHDLHGPRGPGRRRPRPRRRPRRRLRLLHAQGQDPELRSPPRRRPGRRPRRRMARRLPGRLLRRPGASARACSCRRRPPGRPACSRSSAGPRSRSSSPAAGRPASSSIWPGATPRPFFASRRATPTPSKS